LNTFWYLDKGRTWNAAFKIKTKGILSPPFIPLVYTSASMTVVVLVFLFLLLFLHCAAPSAVEIVTFSLSTHISGCSRKMGKMEKR